MKRIISFIFILLLAGYAISNFAIFKKDQPPQDDPQPLFDTQIAQAVKDLQKEVLEEKENLSKIVTEVDEIFDQLDAQKQKLQLLISESQENFNKENDPPKNNQ